jgi:integrase
MVLIFGGLRWGEAVALRRRHCDLLRSQLLIEESVAEVAGKIVFGDTKTHQRRSVFLPPAALDRLAEHLAERDDPSPDALVFTSPRGEVVRYSNFARRVWKPALAAAGIDHYGTHIGRHTSATLLLAAGADAKDVQAHLGHKDAAMTLNVYCAPYDGKRAELAARLGTAWEAVASTPPHPSADVIRVGSGTSVARRGKSKARRQPNMASDLRELRRPRPGSNGRPAV